MYINYEGQTILVSDPISSAYQNKPDWYEQGFGNEWELIPVNPILALIPQIQAYLATVSSLYILLFGAAVQQGINLLQANPTQETLSALIADIQGYPMPVTNPALTTDQLTSISNIQTQLLTILQG